MAPPGRPNITSTRCISRLLISACAPVISLGSIGVLPYLHHLRWSAQSVYLYGLCRLWGLCRGMKTTSHLGGRKAHTAKDRRVRYETSTKMMLGLIGVVRIVVALLHDWEGLDKCLVAGQVGSPRGPPPDVVLFARHRQAPDFSDVHSTQRGTRHWGAVDNQRFHRAGPRPTIVPRG